MKSLFVLGLLLLTCVSIGNAWEFWSGTRTIKRLQVEEKETYRAITIYVDDGFQGAEETYRFMYGCSIAGCFNNTAEGAKIVMSLALSALASGLPVKFYWDDGSSAQTPPPPPDIKCFKIMSAERN